MSGLRMECQKCDSFFVGSGGSVIDSELPPKICPKCGNELKDETVEYKSLVAWKPILIVVVFYFLILGMGVFAHEIFNLL